jgi:glycerophosphoryl diester phosphodiesterase
VTPSPSRWDDVVRKRSPTVPHHRFSVPYVAAHRGASRFAPENTLAAFSTALDRGAVGIELDVHLSGDGRVVVIHDDCVDRTTDGTGLVSQLAQDELGRLDAGSWWSPQFAGERIPLLEEVIQLTDNRAVLHVELKGPAADVLVAETTQIVRRLGAAHRVLLMSFDLEAVRAAKKAGPELPVLAIAGGELQDQLGFVEATGVDGLNQPSRRWVPSTVHKFHERGLLVHGSLVNEPQELNRFFSVGGDMADSDSPDCFSPTASGHSTSSRRASGALTDDQTRLGDR